MPRPPPITINSSPVISTNGQISTSASRDASQRNALTPPTSPHNNGLEHTNIGTHSVSFSTTSVEPKVAQDGVGRFSPIKIFRFDLYDYLIEESHLLGQGKWSWVYLASWIPRPVPEIKKVGSMPDLRVPSPSAEPTPPSTPSGGTSHGLPLAFAVKSPSHRGAVSVLAHEARVLSYLNSLPGSSDHIIPFYGLDPRNDALLLAAVPLSLEQWAKHPRFAHNEELRMQCMQSTFLGLALHLVHGLAWLHGTGIVHADIKPANIVLQPVGRHPCERDAALPGDVEVMASYTPLYIDFSAATLDVPCVMDTKGNPVAGGTWDFQAPELMYTSGVPTRASDVYALAVTLLCTLTDRMPFTDAPNAIIKREMIKQGRVWPFLLDSECERDRIARWALSARHKGPEAERGKTEDMVERKKAYLDTKALFNMALKKEWEERVQAREWAEAWNVFCAS